MYDSFDQTVSATSASVSTFSTNTPQMKRHKVDSLPSMSEVSSDTYDISSKVSSTIVPPDDQDSSLPPEAADDDNIPPSSPTKTAGFFSKLNRGASFRKAVNALKAPVPKSPQVPSPMVPHHNRASSVKNKPTKSKDEFDSNIVPQKRHLSVPKDISQMPLVDMDLLTLAGKQGKGGTRKSSMDSSLVSILSTATTSALSLLGIDEESKSKISAEPGDKTPERQASFELGDSDDEDEYDDIGKESANNDILKAEDNKKALKGKIISSTTMEEDKSILMKSPSLEMLDIQTCRRDSERRGEETLINTLLNKNVTLTYRGDVIREQIKEQKDSNDNTDKICFYGRRNVKFDEP